MSDEEDDDESCAGFDATSVLLLMELDIGTIPVTHLILSPLPPASSSSEKIRKPTLP